MKNLKHEDELRKVIEELKSKPLDKVLVLFQENIQESIAGIVAGRIKEIFYRPTILITKEENAAKGSGRSIEGYHMFEELYACKELFIKFGGHPMAAGLSLPYENIEILQKKLNENCKLTEQQLLPMLKIEKQLDFKEIDMILAKELQNMAPFGKGNHAPLFGSKNVQMENFYLVGKEKNILKMKLKQNGISLQAISFDGFSKLIQKIFYKNSIGEKNCDKMLADGHFEQTMDFVYSIEINTFRGESMIQLHIKDFRFYE